VRLAVKLMLRHGRDKKGRPLFHLLTQKSEDERFAIKIINDDIGIESIHRLLHTQRQLAVGLIPATLDVRDDILRAMRPSAARLFLDS
jgi:hypothetical protein